MRGNIAHVWAMICVIQNGRYETATVRAQISINFKIFVCDLVTFIQPDAGAEG